MAVVELTRISKRYDEGVMPAVDEVSVTVADGEFMVLLGPSGCGKSTTLRMIAGLEPITSGSLRIDGRDMTRVAAKDRDIAMVFQSYALYPHMSVHGNLAFGLKRRGVPKRDIEQRVRDVARMLGLSELLQRRPHALSGGQRQRVALGRAIVRDPKVFLFDEPLSNLDAALRVSTRNELIKQHQRLGATMIYVTHDQVEAMTMGTRICIMNEGALVQVGAPIQVYREPADTFVARFLGNPPMNLLDAHYGESDGGAHVQLGPHRLPLHGYTEGAVGAGADGNVVLGVRPEDLYENPPREIASRSAALPAVVVTVEPLGAETLVGLRIDGTSVDVMARMGRDTVLRPGAAMRVHMDLATLHLFDPVTTRAIVHARPPGAVGAPCMETPSP